MLVGRDDQLTYLGGLLTTAATDGAQLATIAGPTGTGKTALVRAFAARATDTGADLRYVSASPVHRAMPLGVLRQLFGEAAQLCEPSGNLPVGLSDLLERGTDPVVLVVDDAQYADAASLRCLFALVRRLRSVRLAVVLAGQGDIRSAAPTLQVPPPQDIRYGRIWLEPLSGSAVRDLMAQRFDPDVAARLAAGSHAVSGGNPRLVLGLADDIAGDLGVTSIDPVVGAGYRDAVLHSLHRCGPRAVGVAHGLAVLDEWATPGRLARLLHVDVERVSGELRRLNHSGILVGGRFRHPMARLAVLDGMAEAERATLHTGAAGLLHSDRAPVLAIARHLLAARSAEDAWAISALHDVAERAVCDGDLELAQDCLQLVTRSTTDDRQRAATLALLTRAEWRADPAAAARRIPELADVVADGRLEHRHTLTSVNRLLWFGHDRVVADALGRLDRAAGTLSADLTERLRAAQAWLAIAYPGTAATRPLASGDPSGDLPEPQTLTARTTALLTGLRCHPVPADLGADAERILSMSSLLDERSVTANLAALITLIATERLATAEFWCDVLVSETTSAGMTSWRALFTALKADIALRRGDLRLAGEQARTALAVAPAPAWGVGIGLPLAVLAQVDTVTGHRARPAADPLRRPVPGAMFGTPVGLAYLQARGRQLHASGRYRAALADFEHIGRLMRRWRLDFPALFPWRTDAAQTLRCLGRSSDARRLAEEQLSLAGTGATTARAAALRVLAACSEPARRRDLLGEAVDVLQGGGDQLELAHVLTDLSRTHRGLGTVGHARILQRRAEYVARQAGADRPLHALFPPVGEDPSEVAGPAGGQSDELSGAERRVAALAARGHTNRQIAERLSITVSTVEQHLTKVYRKLQVRSRADLPVGLDYAAAVG